MTKGGFLTRAAAAAAQLAVAPKKGSAAKQGTFSSSQKQLVAAGVEMLPAGRQAEPQAICSACVQGFLPDNEMLRCKTCGKRTHQHCIYPPVEKKIKLKDIAGYECLSCVQRNIAEYAWHKKNAAAAAGYSERQKEAQEEITMTTSSSGEKKKTRRSRSNKGRRTSVEKASPRTEEAPPMYRLPWCSKCAEVIPRGKDKWGAPDYATSGQVCVCTSCRGVVHRRCCPQSLLTRGEDSFLCAECDRFLSVFKARKGTSVRVMSSWSVEMVSAGQAGRSPMGGPVFVVRGVLAQGEDQGRKWRSSDVVHALQPRVLVTRNRTILQLQGGIDVVTARKVSFPPHLVPLFSSGFRVQMWAAILKHATSFRPLPPYLSGAEPEIPKSAISQPKKNRLKEILNELPKPFESSSALVPVTTPLAKDKSRGSPLVDALSAGGRESRGGSVGSLPDFLAESTMHPDFFKNAKKRAPALDKLSGSFPFDWQPNDIVKIRFRDGERTGKKWEPGVSGQISKIGKNKKTQAFTMVVVEFVLDQDERRFYTVNSTDLADMQKHQFATISQPAPIAAPKKGAKGTQRKASVKVSDLTAKLGETKWTEEQLDLLHRAMALASEQRAAVGFWAHIAAQVPGKTAAECQKRYVRGGASSAHQAASLPAGRRGKRARPDSKEEDMTRIVEKEGLKGLKISKAHGPMRKRQLELVRRLHNAKEAPDDIFGPWDEEEECEKPAPTAAAAKAEVEIPPDENVRPPQDTVKQQQQPLGGLLGRSTGVALDTAAALHLAAGSFQVDNDEFSDSSSSEANSELDSPPVATVQGLGDLGGRGRAQAADCQKVFNNRNRLMNRINRNIPMKEKLLELKERQHKAKQLEVLKRREFRLEEAAFPDRMRINFAAMQRQKQRDDHRFDKKMGYESGEVSDSDSDSDGDDWLATKGEMPYLQRLSYSAAAATAAAGDQLGGGGSQGAPGDFLLLQEPRGLAACDPFHM